MSDNLNLEGLPDLGFFLQMNEPFFKIPLELYKKNLKEINRLNEKIIEASKHGNKHELKEFISQLKFYEERLKEKVELEDDLILRLNSRIELFDKYSSSKHTFLQTYFNILICLYFIKTTDNEFSQKFIEKLKLHKFIDFDILSKFNSISEEILIKQDIDNQLKSFIKDNEKFLKKIQSDLKFEYLVSRFIMLVKMNENFKALEFLKFEIMQYNKLEKFKYLNEINLINGLLILPRYLIDAFMSYENFLIEHYYKKKYSFQNKNSKVFHLAMYQKFNVQIRNTNLLDQFLQQYDKSLTKNQVLKLKNQMLNKNLFKYFKVLSFTRFNHLNSLFQSDFNQLYNCIFFNSSFQKFISLGLSIYKTRSCSHPKMLSTSSSSSITTCPICSSVPIYKLSKNMKYSHHLTSNLDYLKDPIVLPDGSIFDRAQLIKFNEKLTNCVEERDLRSFQMLILQYPDLMITWLNTWNKEVMDHFGNKKTSVESSNNGKNDKEQEEEEGDNEHENSKELVNKAEAHSGKDMDDRGLKFVVHPSNAIVFKISETREKVFPT